MAFIRKLDPLKPVCFILLLLVAVEAPRVTAFSVSEKAAILRLEIIEYLRIVKPMVYNFPCNPFPQCHQELKAGQNTEEGIHLQNYNQVKSMYQEGMLYFFEANYVNAYNRFLVAQNRIESILEDMSAFYLERAGVMMRSALEPKNSDDPLDANVVDISIDYSRSSPKRADFRRTRESPHYERLYYSKEHHWAQNKYRIEANVQKGYSRISLARKARLQALKIERRVPKGRKLTLYQRRMRIELYLKSISSSRLAKLNAAFIYQLKYPYDNYALQNPFGNTEQGRYEEARVPVIENVRMKWIENPYLVPKKLEPVMDLRIPENFRRDISDARQQVYDVEVDKFIRLKYSKKKPNSYEIVDGKEEAVPTDPNR